MELSIMPDTPQTTDLWQKAFESLEDDLKADIDFKRSTKRDILERTLKTAEEKRQLCLSKQWKYKSNGREIVVRDVLEKIIKWLDHFKSIGDVASQCDTCHAALPWAAVRFLLKVAVSDTQVFGSTVTGLETVSHLITRYTILEHVHMKDRKTAASSQLEHLITGLYAEVLVFLAKAKKYFQTPTPVRILKSTLTSFETQMDQQLQRIASHDAEISALATLSDTETLNRLGELERPIHRIADQVAKYANSLEKERYRSILDWLSPITFVQHQKSHSSYRLPNSEEWLLSRPEYLEWQTSSSSSIFLLRGMAGSGKTSLASAIVDSFLTTSSDRAPSPLLAHFYCSKIASENALCDPGEVMRSILRQLGVSNGPVRTIHGAIVEEYDRRLREAEDTGFDIKRLGFQDCVRLILRITVQDPIIIVVDAIDEIHAESRYELIKALQRIIKESANVVKIFTTSRDDDQLSSLLTNAMTLRIEAGDNSSAMQSLVNHQLSLAIDGCRLLGGDVSQELRTDLTRALKDGAGQCFQLVIWQIERMCSMRHESDIRKAMHGFSTDTLERLYADVLNDIRKSEVYSHKIALHSISLLLSLHEPLSATSFVSALALAEGKYDTTLQITQVLKSCFNLIIVDSNTNTMRFSHTSVQEFLSMQPEFTACETHKITSICCLNSCLYSSPVEVGAGLDPTKHFYHYGMLYWAEHCKSAFTTETDSKLLALVKDFILESDNVSLSFIDWLEEIQKYVENLPRHHELTKRLSAVISHDHSPIFTLCVFGMAELLRQMSQIFTFEWNQKNHVGQSGLYLASYCGQVEVLRILLDQGADVNSRGGKMGTALQAACFEGHVDVVQLLLEKGSDPKLVGRFSHALQASMEGGCEDIAVLLLQTTFNIDDQNEYDQILQNASQAGFISVVDYLQNNYACQFGHLGSRNCTAIRSAISKGHVGVLERFIWRLKDPINELPADSISLAALGGHDRVVKLLLDKALDIEYEGQFGSPLRSASLLGHETTVHMLLDHAAKADSNSAIGNALEAAAMNGHVAVVNLLLARGVNPDTRGGIYGTPLQAASYRGHVKVVETLLDANAGIFKPGFTKDAFHAATEGGRETVVRLLLNRGFSFRRFLRGGEMLCGRWPSSSPSRNLLRLSSPSRLTSAKSRSRQTKSENWKNASLKAYSHGSRGFRDDHALTTAAHNGHLKIVELILDNLNRGGEHILAEEFNHAFFLAVNNGHEQIVKCFLDRKLAEIPQLKEVMPTAAKNGHIAILDMLLADCEVRAKKDEDIFSFEFCTEILRAGCQGDHVIILMRALDLSAAHCVSTDKQSYHKVALLECPVYDSVKTMGHLLNVVRFDSSDILEAIGLSCKHSASRTLPLFLSEYRRIISGDSSLRQRSFSSLNSPSHRAPRNDQQLQQVLDHELYAAASRGDAKLVRDLLEVGAKVDVKFKITSRYYFPMHLDDKNPYENALEAALRCKLPYYLWEHERSEEREAREEVIILLLENAADSKKLDVTFERLLKIAVRYCSHKLVRFVIDKDKSLINTCSTRKEVFKIIAARESRSAIVMHVLLEASGYLSTAAASDGSLLEPSPEDILDQVLKFFDERRHDQFSFKDGRFYESESIHDVLHAGPGAIVKSLLQLLPEKSLKDNRYGFLLQMAIAINDCDWTNFLIKRGVNVNTTGYYYGTALQCAARFGLLELVQLLLSLGAEVNIVAGEHSTALRAAVIGRHPEVVDILLQHGADANLYSVKKGKKESGYDSPQPTVILALDYVDPAIMRSLVAAGLDMYPDISHRTQLLIKACETGKLEIVKSFLNHNVQINPPKQYSNTNEYWFDDERASALHLACSRGQEDITRVLLEHGANVQLEIDVIKPERRVSKTPLQIAANAGHLPIVRLLLGADAEIDYFNSHGTALCIAAKINRLDIVEELLLAGASICGPDDKWNALAEACCSGRGTIVEALLDFLTEDIEREVLTRTFSTPAVFCDDDCLQMLLKQDINVPPTILSQACSKSLHGSILMLLQQGMDINGEDGTGGGALQAAAYAQQVSMVDLLLSHGADTNTSTSKYGTPLQAAIEGYAAFRLDAPRELYESDPNRRRGGPGTYIHGYHYGMEPNRLAICEQIIAALLAKGADPDPLPRSFGNPLQVAAYTGSTSILKQLLDQGANINSSSNRFGTALFAAMENSKEDAMGFLLKAGIDVNHISKEHGTALHYACSRQNIDMANMLLKNGADPNLTCGSHGTLLQVITSMDPKFNDWQDQVENLAETVLCRGDFKQISEQDFLNATKRLSTYRPSGWDSTKPLPGERMLKIFLEHDQTFLLPEFILVAAIEQLDSAGTHILHMLLERAVEPGATKAMIEAAKDPEILKILLNQEPVCPITPELICDWGEKHKSKSTSESYKIKVQIIRLLLDHDKNLPITPAILSAVIAIQFYFGWEEKQECQDLVEYLFERNSDLEVNESMININQEKSVEVLEILLKHAPSLKVTPEMLCKAARCEEEQFELGAQEQEKILLLLAHDKTATIPQQLIKTFSRYYIEKSLAYMTVLLDRAPDLLVTREYIKGLLKNFRYHQNDPNDSLKAHLKLFAKHGKVVKFDEEMHEKLATEDYLDAETRALVYALEDMSASRSHAVSDTEPTSVAQSGAAPVVAATPETPVSTDGSEWVDVAVELEEPEVTVAESRQDRGKEDVQHIVQNDVTYNSEDGSEKKKCVMM